MDRLGGRQRGAVVVLIAAGLLALLAMVGLALDSGHLVLNKSRLQNTVDASALAAAKVLNDTGSEPDATTAARSVFDLNAANHPELADVLSGADITVQFSNTLSPWAPGTTPANYVRVIATDFTMWTSFTRLVGHTDTYTAASAVAGPSAPIGLEQGNEACDLAPMLVCGDTSEGAPGYLGYTGDNVSLLKYAAPGSPDVGPGNFQLVRLGGPGANIVRENAAGGYDECIDPGSTVETQPGNDVGPITQGLNTRFGQYQGPVSSTEYPPDKVTTPPNPDLNVADDNVTVIFSDSGQPVTHINELDYSYNEYIADLITGPYDFPSGVAKRRILAVPFVDCSAPCEGQCTLPVLGLGCFFMLQPANQQGGTNYVYSEFIGDCAADGTPGPEPAPEEEAPFIYKIVLHNDPLSPDS